MNVKINRLWYVCAFFVFLVLAVYYLSPILVPFVFGALLAYLGDPLIDQLEKIKMPRGLAVAFVFSVLLLIVAILVMLLFPLLSNQLNDVYQQAPLYGEWLDETFSKLGAYIGIDNDSINFKELAKEYIPQAGGLTKNLASAVFQSGTLVLNLAVFFMLTPIITFYFLRDWDIMIERIHGLIPHSIRNTVSSLTKECDIMVSAFLRGQFLVMSALGVIYAIGLSLVGLQSAVLVGFIAGVLSFIPYLGTAVGIILASVLFIVQAQEWSGIWQLGLVFFIGQAIEGYVLTPWLVGDRIGLHPLIVIFAVLAGGQLFGFTGVILALPVSAILAVLVRYSLARYKSSNFYMEGKRLELDD